MIQEIRQWGVSKDRRICGGRMRKMHLTGEHFMFPELHMTRDSKASSNGVITAITFLSDAITKEATQARARFKFGMLMWRKSDKTNTTKDTKQRIVGCTTIQTLIRSLVVNS
jgi:capsule polysaccharide export protein KpsC/LpsZ